MHTIIAICFDINASNAAGDTFPVAGGGGTDWAQGGSEKRDSGGFHRSTDNYAENLITPMINSRAH